MRTSLFTALFSVCCFLGTQAQSLKEIQKQMQLIPGGDTQIGGGYQFEVKGASMYYLGVDDAFADQNKDQVAIGEIPFDNNPWLQVSVAPFYLSEKEVTNQQYRDFLLHTVLTPAEKEAFLDKLKELQADESKGVMEHWNSLFTKADAKGLMLDQEVWSKDFVFAYNEPLVDNYFWHPAFNDYPVVGVNWEQANAYCSWLSDLANADRAKRGLAPQPDFRLPTEVEWEFAALGGKNVSQRVNGMSPVYPWSNGRMWDDKGQLQANIKTDHRNYIGDGYEYTAPVGSFKANEYGLYDMAGNVSEWTQDVFVIRGNSEGGPISVAVEYKGESDVPTRVVKGGSWADYRYAAQTGSRCRVNEKEGHSRVGFRVAMTKMD